MIDTLNVLAIYLGLRSYWYVAGSFGSKNFCCCIGQPGFFAFPHNMMKLVVELPDVGSDVVITNWKRVSRSAYINFQVMALQVEQLRKVAALKPSAVPPPPEDSL